MARPASWWGWGEGISVSLDSRPGLKRHLERALGPIGDRRLSVPDAEDVQLPPSRFVKTDLTGFRDIVGAAQVGNSHRDRLSHAVGKSYRDLLRLRLNRITAAPDVVLYPRHRDDVQRILGKCSELGAAVVPFGGGTTVVGGVEASDESRRHVTVDLRGLNRLLTVDPASCSATVEAGISGPTLEGRLAEHRLTLGHAPQSFEFSTVGGWIASRSAGALSNQYGKIEDLVMGLTLISPSGPMRLSARPRHAMGPDLTHLVVGSEGTLGIITEASLEVHGIPPVRAFDAFVLPGFDQGLEVLRAIAQSGVPPAMTYLFDEDETRLLVSASEKGSTAASALLRLRGVRLESASLLLLGYEGTRSLVRTQRNRVKKAIRKGVSVGGSVAEDYAMERYNTPYLRDDLIEHRIMTDTVETAALWSSLAKVYEGARKALVDAIAATGVPGLVGCHVSHIYPEGASLYFTFMAPMRQEEELSQYDSVKAAAVQSFARDGGRVSHHHGIGAVHRQYWRQAIGTEAYRVLLELKRSLDPANLMNPGKLFPVVL